MYVLPQDKNLKNADSNIEEIRRVEDCGKTR